MNHETGNYLLDIRRGLIIGQEIVNVIGHKYALGTTEVTVGALSATDDIDQSGISATPARVKVSSTSANDTSAGTGMRTVCIFGLDSDGAKIDEIVTLNGTTDVLTVATFCAVNGMRGETWGSLTWNDGTIYCGGGTVSTGKPATILMGLGYDSIRSRGANKALDAYYVVPTGKTFYGVHLTATIGTDAKEVQMHVQTSDDGVNWVTEEAFEYGSNSNITKPINALPPQTGGKHIRLTAVSSDAGTNISAVLDGVLIDD